MVKGNVLVFMHICSNLFSDTLVYRVGTKTIMLSWYFNFTELAIENSLLQNAYVARIYTYTTFYILLSL